MKTTSKGSQKMKDFLSETAKRQWSGFKQAHMAEVALQGAFTNSDDSQSNNPIIQ